MSGFVRCGGGGNVGSGSAGDPRIIVTDYLASYYLQNSVDGDVGDFFRPDTNGRGFSTRQEGNRSNGAYEGLVLPIINLDYLKTYTISFDTSCSRNFSHEIPNGVFIMPKMGNMKEGYKNFLVSGGETKEYYRKARNFITWDSMTAYQVYHKELTFGKCDGFAGLGVNLHLPDDGKEVYHYFHNLDIVEASSSVIKSAPLTFYNSSASHNRRGAVVSLKNTGVTTSMPVRISVKGKCENGAFYMIPGYEETNPSTPGGSYWGATPAGKRYTLMSSFKDIYCLERNDYSKTSSGKHPVIYLFYMFYTDVPYSDDNIEVNIEAGAPAGTIYVDYKSITTSTNKSTDTGTTRPSS